MHENARVSNESELPLLAHELPDPLGRFALACAEASPVQRLHLTCYVALAVARLHVARPRRGSAVLVLLDKAIALPPLAAGLAATPRAASVYERHLLRVELLLVLLRGARTLTLKLIERRLPTRKCLLLLMTPLGVLSSKRLVRARGPVSLSSGTQMHEVSVMTV